jgi:hypothetical protein
MEQLGLAVREGEDGFRLRVAAHRFLDLCRRRLEEEDSKDSGGLDQSGKQSTAPGSET